MLVSGNLVINIHITVYRNIGNNAAPHTHPHTHTPLKILLSHSPHGIELYKNLICRLVSTIILIDNFSVDKYISYSY